MIIVICKGIVKNNFWCETFPPTFPWGAHMAGADHDRTDLDMSKGVNIYFDHVECACQFQSFIVLRRSTPGLSACFKLALCLYPSGDNPRLKKVTNWH